MGVFLCSLYGKHNIRRALNLLENKRTLENLLEPNCKTYLYLTDDETTRVFIQNAEAEGFTFSDGVKISKRQPEDVMVLNEDKTINFLGFADNLTFHNPEATSTYLVRVDYRKYILGEEKFLYEPIEKVVSEDEKLEPRMSDGTATILVYDKSIGMDCEFVKWLKQEGFIFWRYSKGWYDSVCWLFINLNNKLIACGIPGIKITEPFCHHAITIDEFKTIYSIFKKYDGKSLLEF